jgi:acetyl/propionyl-CoA carboxylase alpha subunit
MGAIAVRAARACDYTNAGTVEFIFDQKKNFYFLEMNTRIQVEHPITECTTGVDLVQWQLRIASGEELTIRQEDLVQRGHAIECRVYAEDPEQQFMPSAGKILALREPVGPGIRVDSGVYPGCEVSVYYDPILAKLITYGEDRDQARRRMIRALKDYVVQGIRTQTAYLAEVLAHPAFIEGDTTTDFIPEHMAGWQSPAPDEGEQNTALILAALFRLWQARSGGNGRGAVRENMPTPWDTVGPWEVGAGR